MADESWLSSVRPSLGIKRWCLGNIGLSSHQGGGGGGAVLWKSITQGEGGKCGRPCWFFYAGHFFSSIAQVYQVY